MRPEWLCKADPEPLSTRAKREARARLYFAPCTHLYLQMAVLLFMREGYVKLEQMGPWLYAQHEEVA